MNKYFSLSIILILLSVNILKAQPFEWFKSLSGHETPITFLCFNQDRQELYSGDKSGKILIWNTDRGRLIKRLNAHEGEITHLELSIDKKQLLSAGYDGLSKIWNLESNQVLHTFNNPGIASYAHVKGNEPSFALFTEDQKGVIYGGYNMQINQSGIDDEQNTTLFRNRLGGITAGELNPSKNQLAFAVNNRMYIYDFHRKRIVNILKHEEILDDFICELHYLPQQDSLLAAWTYGGEIKIWNTFNNRIQYSFSPTPQKGSSAFAFSKNGQQVLTGNKANVATLWSVPDFQPLQVFSKHTSPIQALAFSQDNEFVATGGNDHLVVLWKKKKLPELNTEEMESATIMADIHDRSLDVQESIIVSGDKLKLSVYDHDEQDGDVISLLINDHLVLKQYHLTHQKKFLEVPLREGVNYLIIYAHNEGRITPNTVAIGTEDLDQKNTFQLYSNMNSSAVLKVIVRQ